MNRNFPIFFAVGAAALAFWLFTDEKFAEPGSLAWMHRESAECMDCHRAWKGAGDEMCLQCHDFSDVSLLKPQIRFHEAQANCTSCHTEHKGVEGNISAMNHGILNEDLQCTQCHVDPHGGLFGEDCRECHGIGTWRVHGYRHPSEESDCKKCHKAPPSHRIEGFWEFATAGKYKEMKEADSSFRNDCARCHIPHRWDHLRMKHVPDTGKAP